MASALSVVDGIALCASRLRGAHARDAVFVDLNDVASRVWAGPEALEAFRSPENDRVGVAAGLDQVALLELLVEEHVEAVPASPSRVDLSHRHEYRKRGSSAVWRGMALRTIAPATSTPSSPAKASDHHSAGSRAARAAMGTISSDPVVAWLVR